MCAAVLFIFSKFLSGSHSKLHLHCCFLHCCSWFCFIFSQLLLSLTHWTSPVHQSEKSPCRHWFLSFSFSSPFSPFPILVFFFFSPPVFHIGSLFLSGSPSSPLTAEAPGHFLSGLPAAPHHHQPHRPLPPSERSSHAQAFPCATHHPGHALGAALSLQSMRPPWNQPPPPFHRVHHHHHPLTPTSSCSSLHLFRTQHLGGRSWDDPPPPHPSFETLCLGAGTGTLRTSWDWLLSS